MSWVLWCCDHVDADEFDVLSDVAIVWVAACLHGEGLLANPSGESFVGFRVSDSAAISPCGGSGEVDAATVVVDDKSVGWLVDRDKCGETYLWADLVRDGLGRNFDDDGLATYADAVVEIGGWIVLVEDFM